MSKVSPKKTLPGVAGSKKYRANLSKIQEAKAKQKSAIFEVAEAVQLLMSLDQPNFKDGPTLELHFKLNIDTTKSDQLVRGSMTLPHGTGKSVRLAAFVNSENVELAKKLGATRAGSEDLIEEIKNNPKVDFDIAIAQPDMMKKLPAIARVLGTAGVMPNPKTGTVGDNVEELIKEFLGGKINFKNDKSGNLHIPCGKINKKFDAQKLVENVTKAMEVIEKSKPDGVKKKFVLSAYLATSMSPSLQIL